MPKSKVGGITLGEELEAQRCIEKSPRLPHALSLPWRRAPVYPLMSKINIQALLLAMLVAAAFFGGMAVQKKLDKPTIRVVSFDGGTELVLPDGCSRCLQDLVACHRRRRLSDHTRCRDEPPSTVEPIMRLSSSSHVGASDLCRLMIQSNVTKGRRSGANQAWPQAAEAH
jgi:hypothetical protein